MDLQYYIKPNSALVGIEGRLDVHVPPRCCVRNTAVYRMRRSPTGERRTTRRHSEWCICRERRSPRPSSALVAVCYRPPTPTTNQTVYKSIPTAQTSDKADTHGLQTLLGIEMSGNDFFNPILSHSQWFILIPIPDPRFNLVLLPFPSHSHWLFPFFPVPIPVLLEGPSISIRQQMTGKLNNALSSTITKT